MRRNRRDKNRIREIAQERIAVLTHLARKRLEEGNAQLAKRYCQLARMIQLKHRVRLKKEMGLKYCKMCYIPWIFGKNVHVRNNSKTHCTEYACGCGYVKRYGYARGV